MKIILRPDLCVAIKNRYSISIPFTDEGVKHILTIEPYIYGVDHSGNGIVKAYSIDDRGKEGWMLYKATTIPPIEKDIKNKISFIPNRLDDFDDSSFHSIHCSVIKKPSTSDDFSDLNQNYIGRTWLQYNDQFENHFKKIKKTVFDGYGDIRGGDRRNWWGVFSPNIKLRSASAPSTFIEIGLIDPPEVLYVVAVRKGKKISTVGVAFDDISLGLREVLSVSLSLGMYDDFLPDYVREAKEEKELRASVAEDSYYYAEKEAWDTYESEFAKYDEDNVGGKENWEN